MSIFLRDPQTSKKNLFASVVIFAPGGIAFAYMGLILINSGFRKLDLLPLDSAIQFVLGAFAFVMSITALYQTFLQLRRVESISISDPNAVSLSFLTGQRTALRESETKIIKRVRLFELAGSGSRKAVLLVNQGKFFVICESIDGGLDASIAFLLRSSKLKEK